jgi:hypothetical protein
MAREVGAIVRRPETRRTVRGMAWARVGFSKEVLKWWWLPGRTAEVGVIAVVPPSQPRAMPPDPVLRISFALRAADGLHVGRGEVGEDFVRVALVQGESNPGLNGSERQPHQDGQERESKAETHDADPSLRR